ncbi:molybdate ABC transporter substrate-binding protein [Frigidibacter sp. ROC022]|uniref:molybdate ABC transporter substrate-binding protein n=1 Tax=Frigidibacter sp. ROC022 TaxID=2971796 RepID=UPI00215AA78E|nr:molybdate ABC transporter substrate-binding protein [Frigidibacter sp. ROC022]MCR8722861.1 molybdate ABC transporter substrate-binding protein [Frigidibacter sp. ROC022]
MRFDLSRLFGFSAPRPTPRRAGPGRLLRRLALCLPLGLAPPAAGAADQITVFAAASLKNALDAIAGDWQAQGGAGLRLTYAGSSQLAKQIEAGAPADMFLSASIDWMDYLDEAGLIDRASRHDLAGNALVLIVPAQAPAPEAGRPPPEVGPGYDLAGRLGDGKLAMALVDAVPAGVYGKQALSSLGLWEIAAPHVAQADNVRAALALVASGEAAMGVVYATDAAAEPRVRVLATFPESSHDPIRYPVALVDGGDPAAADFLDYLLSGPAREELRAQGFAVPD